jgi:hypothetical protein
VVDSPTQITAVVPPGAGTGPISVATGAGTATSAGAFVVQHARSLGLHAKAARGSLSVPDGWGACAAQVPVRLQRAQHGGTFRTVTTDLTNGAGTYRFADPDEPGRYRVVARKLTLGSADVCLRAVSPIMHL